MSFRYLVLKADRVNCFIGLLRKNLPASDASLYLFANTTLLSPASTIEEIYAKHKASDGALYLTLADVPTFGHA